MNIPSPGGGNNEELSDVQMRDNPAYPVADLGGVSRFPLKPPFAATV